MEFTETVNLKAAKYLQQITFEEFCEFTNFSARDERKEYGKMKKQMVKYIKNPKQVIKYNYSKVKKNWGRLYAPTGLQMMDGKIKGVLSEGITRDLDLVNSYPTVLKWLCKKHNIHHHLLANYCENREEILNGIIKSDNTTKALAKTSVIKALDTEYKTKSKDPFLKKLDLEFIQIQKDLREIPEYDWIFNQITSKENVNGKFIANLCEHQESVFIHHLIKYLKDFQGIETGTYMYDGLMIYSDGVDENLLIEDIQISFNNEFEFECDLKFKDYNDDILIPDDFVPRTILFFWEVASEFEKNHIQVGSQFVKETEGNIEILSKGQLIDTYSFMSYMKDDGKEGNFIKDWVNCNPSIRRANKMNIYANEDDCPKGDYNLWIPFKYNKLKNSENSQEANEGLERYKKHIEEICDNKEEIYKFLHRWIAHSIKYPENKSLLIYLLGEQGSGKGLFIAYLKSLFGKKKVFETSDPQNEVWGHFNSLMKDAFMVVINEIDGGDTYKAMGKLKQLTTDEGGFNLNCKYKEPISLNSFHRFIITTNNSDAIKQEKGQRRNVYIQGGSTYIIPEDCEDKELIKNCNNYYSTRWKDTHNDEVIKAIWSYYKNMKDIPKDFNRCEMPETELGQILNEKVYNEIDCFVMEQKTTEEGKWERPRDVYTRFLVFCKKEGYKYPPSAREFSVKLTLKKITGVYKGTQGHHICWRFNRDEIDKYFNKQNTKLPTGKCFIDLNKEDIEYVKDPNILYSDDDDCPQIPLQIPPQIPPIITTP